MSSDFPLLEYYEQQRAEQTQNIERVSKRIRSYVLAFCKLALAQGGRFHSEELREYVSSRIIVAPGSVDRILRELRKQCQINYTVESRSKSLYRVTEIK